MAPIKPEIIRMSYRKWNNKTRSNMKINCWTLGLVLFAIHLNLEQQFADYREEALLYSGHF